MYAVYHGPKGLQRIAERAHLMASCLHHGFKRLGYDLGTAPFFDTLKVGLGSVRPRHSSPPATR